MVFEFAVRDRKSVKEGRQIITNTNDCFSSLTRDFSTVNPYLHRLVSPITYANA